MNPVHLVDAVRTPTGRYNGSLAGVRVEDACFENADGAGEENRDVAGTAVLRAGPPASLPGGTGVATLCLGVGQGLALALARVLLPPALALVLER